MREDGSSGEMVNELQPQHDQAGCDAAYDCGAGWNFRTGVSLGDGDSRYR